MTVGGVSLDPKVSLGHLIQIVTLIVVVTLAWGNADGRISANALETERSNAAITEVKAASLERDNKQDINISVLTRDYNAMALVLEGIRIDVGYLRRNVEDTKRAAVSP